MKVIEKGRLHEAIAWEDTCEFCGSRLRMFEDRGDPAVLRASDFGAYARKITYICPICTMEQTAYSANNEYEGINNTECEARRKRCKTTRKKVILTLEDMEEIKSYKQDENE